MTKKFWNDWQKRIGETKNVYFFFYKNTKMEYRCDLLNEINNDRILKASFHGDIVDLMIETRIPTSKGTIHVENSYLTLNRKDILSVEFKRL